jgi:FHA domain
MPILIVEHSGKRKRATLNGAASIGRTPNNDVVIEHPAVSRTHALIERTGDTYFIADNKSKNGTVVANQHILQKQPLKDGDRIEIGPAVLTFHLSDDHPEQSTQTTLSETHAGMLMDCECGAKLWVPKEMVGGRGQCQKCGRTLTLGVTKPATTRTCSICQWKLEPADTQHTCPACGLVFHQDCWNENRGCSAYGCSQVNILDKPEEVTEVMEEIGHPPMIIQPVRFPWEFAFLAASVVASLVGLLAFGALALATLLLSGIYLLKHGRKTKVPILLAAMAVSLVGLLAGVVVSCIWWLNLPLHHAR